MTEEITVGGIHPKKLADMEKKRILEEERVALLRHGFACAQFHGLKFFHIMPTDHCRGMTIAYRVNKRSIIKVSTAICHPDDQFSKKEGAAHAAINFDNDNFIELFIPAYMRSKPEWFLGDVFQKY